MWSRPFASAGLALVLLAAGCQSGDGKPRIVPSETLEGSVRGDTNARLRSLPSRVHFFDEQHGLMQTGEGRVLETRDAGLRWRPTSRSYPRQAPTPRPERRPPCVGGTVVLSRVGRTLGYALCAGQPGAGQQLKRLYATRDGGSTWALRNAAVPSGGYASWLAFRSADLGMLAASRYGLLATSDGGRHWRSSLFTDDWTPEAFAWPSPRRMFVVLRQLGLVRSDDGGRRWRQVYPALPGPPAGPVSFSTVRNGIGARSEGLDPDGGVIVGTRDGGRTWGPRSRILGYHVRQLERASATSVWAVAARPLLNRGGYSRIRLFRSDDDGRRWRSVPAPPLGYGTLSVVDERVAFLYGEQGTLRTDDGGATWSRRGEESIYAAGFLDQDHGYGTKGDDRLLATSDGGKSWDPVALPGGFRLLDVSVDPPDRVWLVGNGRTLRSEDGGRQWTQISFRTAVPPVPAEWLGGRFGVSPHGVGGHYQTLDGGRTWRFVVATIRLAS